MTRANQRQQDAAARAVLAISGQVIQLLGAGLALWGLLLNASSPFYAVAGTGFILAGALLAKRKRAGAWVYLAVFALTLAWSLRNVDHGGSPLAMRLIGPIVLLSMISLIMPALRGWRAQRTVLVFSALLIGTVALGMSWSSGGMVARSRSSATQFLVPTTD